MTLPDATRLGSEAGGSPRSEFHTYFWVSVSQLQALGSGGGGRAQKAKAPAGVVLQQGRDPQPSSPCPWQEQEGEQEGTGRPLGSHWGAESHSPSSFSLVLTAGAGPEERKARAGSHPFPPKLRKSPELRGLASKLPMIQHPYLSKSHPQLPIQGQGVLRPLLSHPNLQMPGEQTRNRERLPAGQWGPRPYVSLIMNST